MLLRAAGVSVPASTSNLGAGYDCLGLAVDRYLSAEYEPGPAALAVDRDADDPLVGAGPDLVFGGFVQRLTELGAPEPFGRLSVRSEIPLRRGLGSSAAAALAGRALAELATGAWDIDRHSLFRRVAVDEGHADNAAAAALGGLVAVTAAGDSAFSAVRVSLSEDVGFAFAAPATGVSTRDARRALPAAVPHAAAARGLGRLAALLTGLARADGSLIAAGLDDELHVPYRLPLIPGSADAISAAVDAGAWGATVSGSGSGILAICEPGIATTVAAAMAAAFRRIAGEGVIAFPLRPVLEGVQPLAAAASVSNVDA